MASSTRMFLAGVGTTFALLGMGFGGGLMLAKSALHDVTPVQTRASLEKPSPVRVILPESAEAAQPPQPGKAVPAEPPPAPVAQAVAVQPMAAEKPPEKMDTKKAERQDRERHRRYAERKARRIARARQQLEQPQQRPEPGVMAFDGEQPRTVGFFGN
jgi:hypothetical protein